MFAWCITLSIVIPKVEPHVGVITLQIMSSDEKDRTLRWFHMDHLIREYLFSTLLNLKANISSFLYILMSVRQVFTEIRVVLITCL